MNRRVGASPRSVIKKISALVWPAEAVPPEGSWSGDKFAMLSFDASYECHRPCRGARSILSSDARSSRTDGLKDAGMRESGPGTESPRRTALLPGSSFPRFHARLLGDLELHWPPRFLLHDGRARRYPAIQADVAHLQLRQVARSQLAFDRQVEHRQITGFCPAAGGFEWPRFP